MAGQPENISVIDTEAAARVIAATRSRKFTPPDICPGALAADLEEVRKRYASFGRSALARLDAQTVAELVQFVEAVGTVEDMVGEREQTGKTVYLRGILLAAIDAQVNVMAREGLVDDPDGNSGAAEILEDALLYVRLLRKWARFAIGVNDALKHETKAAQKAVYLAFAIWLPSIYERHFGRPFGISRPPHKSTLGGPGVRFVMAAAAEIGIYTSSGTLYAPDIIIDARERLKGIMG
jgi:hypothetical protein